MLENVYILLVLPTATLEMSSQEAMKSFLFRKEDISEKVVLVLEYLLLSPAENLTQKYWPPQEVISWFPLSFVCSISGKWKWILLREGDIFSGKSLWLSLWERMEGVDETCWLRCLFYDQASKLWKQVGVCLHRESHVWRHTASTL